MGPRVFQGLAVVLLAIFWLALPADSAAQANSSQTYNLEGTVNNSVTGEPVSYALVTISSENKQALMTGPDGRFQFTGLRAGRVTVAASKPGFFEDGPQQVAGGKQPGRIFVSGSIGRIPVNSVGVNIEVGPDTSPVIFKLVPEGIITGHVEDAYGEPIEAAMVRVEAATVSNGRKRWVQLQGAVSKEDGSFRIANLHPGRYWLNVHAGPRGRTLEDITGTNPVGFPLAVYYPAAADRASATSLDLAAGQHLEVQFALKLQPVFKISGEVSGRNKDQYINLRLVSPSGEELGAPARFNPTDGRFEIDRVPAGNYRLEARGESVGELPLQVSRNLSGIRMLLQPRISIPVIIRDEAAPTEDVNAQGLRPIHYGRPVAISLYRTDLGQESMTARMDQKAEDSAPSINVPPGKYSVELMPLNGLYVQSARYGDTDLLREDLVVQPGVAPRPLEVVLRNDGAALTVKIMRTSANAATSVVVLPEAAPTQVKIVYLGGEGEGLLTGSINGLAPGDYRLFAFDDPNAIEFRNPEVLKQYSARAAHLTLNAGKNSSATLELIQTGQ